MFNINKHNKYNELKKTLPKWNNTDIANIYKKNNINDIKTQYIKETDNKIKNKYKRKNYYNIIILDGYLYYHDISKNVKLTINKKIDNDHYKQSKYIYLLLNNKYSINNITICIKENIVKEKIAILYIHTKNSAEKILNYNIQINVKHNTSCIVKEQIINANNKFSAINIYNKINISKNAYCMHDITSKETYGNIILNKFIDTNIKRHGTYEVLQISKNNAFNKIDFQIKLQEEYAKCIGNSLNMLNNTAYNDWNVYIEHLASYTESNIHSRSIVSDYSKSTFFISSHIAKNIKNIIVIQNSHNIQLSKLSQINISPNLEIYSKDIECYHGATIGKIDKEEIFYLQSRGISINQALLIIITIFIKKIFIKNISSIFNKNKHYEKSKQYLLNYIKNNKINI